MPIGWIDDGGGATREEPEPPRPPGYDPTPEIARALVDDLVPLRIEQWLTAEDERVCPECGPLDGVLFSEFSGFYPPLHNNCRCERVFHHFEYQRAT